MDVKPKVAFICTHNSCRSQMAEAISRIFAADALEAFSAGTDIKSEINPDAVKAVGRLYGYDMAENQHPKLIGQIPAVDYVITMGCGVSCPFLPCAHREDWGLDDPTGKPFGEFLKTAEIIKDKVEGLRYRIISQNN